MKRFTFFYLLALTLCAPSCGTVRTLPVQDSTRTEVKVVEKIVRDTAWLQLPAIAETVATRDTASVLENKYAISAAQVSGGVLTHSLATKPVREPVSVESKMVVRDSIVWRDRVVRETVEVERELTSWQKLKMRTGGLFIGFWLVCFVLVVIYFLFNPKFFKL